MARRTGSGAWPLALGIAGPVALFTAYFTIPLGAFGPDHPVLSWIVLAAVLVLIAVILLREIRRALVGRPGRPVLVIVLLVCAALVAFSTTYLGLARAGEMKGLYTKVDSLYFTVITQTTVGYGDIVPVGQTARVLTMIQLLYGLGFVATGGTALSRTLRDQFQRRTMERERRGKI
jgi:hypothetical protein